MAPDEVAWREYNVHDDQSGEGEEEAASNTPVDIFATQEEDVCEIQEYKFDSGENGQPTTISLQEQGDYDVSTGMSVWKGSEILSQYLTKHPDLIHQKRILELGAGVGLCGIVCAKVLGASSVLLTDGDHIVLRNLRNNVELNDLETTVSCAQLIWGKSRAKEFEKANGKQDIILATDCVYVTKSVRPLFETVDSILVPDGVFLFVNSCASICPLEEVMSIAKEFGFVASPDEMWYQTVNEKYPVYVFRRICS